jgi:ribosomal protein S12 methylthiotransferase accessory factor YcaO
MTCATSTMASANAIEEAAQAYRGKAKAARRPISRAGNLVTLRYRWEFQDHLTSFAIADSGERIDASLDI